MTHEREDYTLRLIIEQMLRDGSSEREIEVAVREASGGLERQAPRTEARPRTTKHG
jgi:hypothetical protein